MALSDLVASAAEPFTPEERIAQTEKLVQRTFGVPAGELGELAMLDGRPVLTIQHNGAAHALTWSRDPKGRVVWNVDGTPAMGVGGDNALVKLARALDNL
ncbi:MAG: hypothetical protein HC914_16205 [Chloroflexaceae bacterium]|nr:hypothetical protein [Chloroflexaceae bacterium]